MYFSSFSRSCFDALAMTLRLFALVYSCVCMIVEAALRNGFPLTVDSDAASYSKKNNAEEVVKGQDKFDDFHSEWAKNEANNQQNGLIYSSIKILFHGFSSSPFPDLQRRMANPGRKSLNRCCRWGACKDRVCLLIAKSNFPKCSLCSQKYSVRSSAQRV